VCVASIRDAHGFGLHGFGSRGFGRFGPRHDGSRLPRFGRGDDIVELWAKCLPASPFGRAFLPRGGVYGPFADPYLGYDPYLLYDPYLRYDPYVHYDPYLRYGPYRGAPYPVP